MPSIGPDSDGGPVLSLPESRTRTGAFAHRWQWHPPMFDSNPHPSALRATRTTESTRPIVCVLFNRRPIACCAGPNPPSAARRRTDRLIRRHSSRTAQEPAGHASSKTHHGCLPSLGLSARCRHPSNARNGSGYVCEPDFASSTSSQNSRALVAIVLISGSMMRTCPGSAGNSASRSFPFLRSPRMPYDTPFRSSSALASPAQTKLSLSMFVKDHPSQLPDLNRQGFVVDDGVSMYWEILQRKIQRRGEPFQRNVGLPLIARLAAGNVVGDLVESAASKRNQMIDSQVCTSKWSLAELAGKAIALIHLLPGGTGDVTSSVATLSGESVSHSVLETPCRDVHRTFGVRYSKAGIRDAQSAGQRIEIMRLPARHDIDVECRAPLRSREHRRKPANQHIGNSVPVDEAHEGFGVEWRSVGVTHGEVEPPER